MTSYVVRVNEGIMLGRSLMNYLKTLSKTSDYLYVMKPKEDESYFTKEDFERVEDSKKSGICDDITELENLLKSKK